MTRLYAAGHKAVAVVEDGKVRLTLDERGARCLAVDPGDPDTLYAAPGSPTSVSRTTLATRLPGHLTTRCGISAIPHAVTGRTLVRPPGLRNVTEPVGDRP